MGEQKNDSLQQSETKTTPVNLLKEKPVPIFKGYHATIATIAAIIMSIGGGMLWLHQSTTESIKQELELSKEKLEELGGDNRKLKDDNRELQTHFVMLKRQERAPVLIAPVAGQPVIGRHVSFRWKFDPEMPVRDLIIELRHINMDKKKQVRRRYQIPKPDLNKMDFQFPQDISGEFFWRVGTGELLNDETKPKSTMEKMMEENLGNADQLAIPKSISSETRLWSRYGNFEIYPNLLEKIRHTSKIVVGMTNTFLSYDHIIDCKGRPDTFDMEFIEWVIKQLETKLANTAFNDQIEIKLVRNVMDWNELFNHVATGQVDIAVANITRSKSREKKYPGMAFSAGYRENHQRIVYSRALDTKGKLAAISDFAGLQKALKNEVLAVQGETINHDAAHYLKHLKKGTFFPVKSINKNHASYVNVIDAVIRGKARFGMLDSIRLDTVHYPELGIIDVELTPYLQEFYREKLGYQSKHKEALTEEYAIAISTGGKRSIVLEKINEIIKSPDGIKRLEELEKIYRQKKRTLPSLIC